MPHLQITSKPTPRSLSLTIIYPDLPNLTYNFKLLLTVSQHPRPQTPPLSKTIYIPQPSIIISPLPGNRIYKVQVALKAGGQEFTKTLFSYVPDIDRNEEQNDGQVVQEEPIPVYSALNAIEDRRQRRRGLASRQKVKPVDRNAFCNSEQMMRMVGKSVGITNEKKLDRYLLECRKCKNTSEFVKTRQQFVSGNPKRAIEKQKMVLKGKLVLNDVYQQSQGRTFFKNDWFMGPFYSYNQNEQEMANH